MTKPLKVVFSDFFFFSLEKYETLMRLLKKYISGLVKLVFIILALAVVFLIFSIPIGKDVKKGIKTLSIEYLSPESTSEIISVKSGLIKPVVYQNINKLSLSESNEHKDLYVDLLLPVILISKYQIGIEKNQTERIREKIKLMENLSTEDSIFINELFEKYKTKNLVEIHQKQFTHPNSIILAQSILETGWGSSRFFLHGNNAFGIWSFNKHDNRMVASSNRDGIIIFLKKYNDLLESVNDYFLTISRSWAFDEFREKRMVSDNAYELIWYLNKYSELRNDYVKKVGEIIVQNNLTQYDTVQLDPSFFINVKLD